VSLVQTCEDNPYQQEKEKAKETNSQSKLVETCENNPYQQKRKAVKPPLCKGRCLRADGGIDNQKNQNESCKSVRYILLKIKIYLKIAYISKKVLTIKVRSSKLTAVS